MNMLRINKNIFWFAALFLTMACEEVIEIDLNSANPAMVAEGVIKKDTTAWIKLSYTSDYFEDEEAESIKDVQVILTNSTGDSETLQHVEGGYYKGSSVFGIEKQNYSISVQVNDKLYTAATYIHAASEITEVKVEENSMQRPGHDASYSATITFNDEVGLNNFYMLKFIVNDTLQTDRYSLVDDNLYADKGSIEFTPMVLNLEINDDVEVQLYSIDEDTYIYYSQLNDQSGNMMNSSTPYNSISNFGNEVMGYFAGWSVTKYRFVVKL